ncbi:MAG TPA: hypothetical protein VMR21_15120, partial [Vicinamibacteria bacterium]|nr:hypothetical protein [Vicinamibacteria bacterium]
MRASREPGPALMRLVRMGRDRRFSRPQFEAALEGASAGSTRGAVLRELLLEWAGVTVDEAQAVELWEDVLSTL